MQDKIQEALDSEGTSNVQVADVCDIPQPFHGLETEYKQMKYFRESLRLLVRTSMLCNTNLKMKYMLLKLIRKIRQSVFYCHTSKTIMNEKLLVVCHKANFMTYICSSYIIYGRMALTKSLRTAAMTFHCWIRCSCFFKIHLSNRR